MKPLSEQEIVRREKLQKLRELGIDPYPAKTFEINTNSKKINENFEEEKKVFIAGRIMSRRIQGKASFAELQDNFGKVQLYFNRDEICIGDDKTKYNEIYKKLLDIGDIIGIEGNLFKTMVGEKTIMVKDFIILNKSLKPLPIPKTDSDGNKYDEFTDPELRYRQRYVDLILNDTVKETFIKRTQIINSIRNFLNEKSYIEVETPILQPIPGGASARPFVTHHNTLNIPLYLRIANELYLKRLIVGGFDGVYEFSKDFRNEGMDRTHNPEFTVLELYVAYKDYFWMMKLTENLLGNVVNNLFGKTKIKFQKQLIDFTPPFKKIKFHDLIKEATGKDISNMDLNELMEFAKELKIEVDETMGVGKLTDLIFSEKCEKKLIQPTFIIDYPKEMSPLTKTHRSNPKLTERFELFVNGKEIANAYSELNDPIDQLERFKDQLKLSEKGDEEAMFIDNDFIRSLEYGMPPTAGIGIGIDRLIMLLTDNSSIQEVLFFPQMKPEKKIIEMTLEEKLIISILKEKSPINLNNLKKKVGISNTKFEKYLKKLVKNSSIKISKKDNEILVYNS